MQTFTISPRRHQSSRDGAVTTGEYHANSGDDDFITLKGLMTEFDLRLSVAVPLAEGLSTRDRSSTLEKMRDKKFKVASWGDAFKRQRCSER